MLPDALATPLRSEDPVEPSDRITDALLQLRARIAQATTAEVGLRSKRLLEQLRRLARFTARELGRAGTPRPDVLRKTLASLEQACGTEDDSSLELMTCRLVCAELSRRRPSRGRAPDGRTDLGSRLEELRLDVGTLVDWAKGDLWNGVARRAVLEASRTATSLEAQGTPTAPALNRALQAVGRSPASADALTRVAEQLALGELKRLLTRIRIVPAPPADPEASTDVPRRVRTSVRQRGLGSAHRALLTLAPAHEVQLAGA